MEPSSLSEARRKSIAHRLEEQSVEERLQGMRAVRARVRAVAQQYRTAAAATPIGASPRSQLNAACLRAARSTQVGSLSTRELGKQPAMHAQMISY